MTFLQRLQQGKPPEPYRILFPTGSVLALMGILPWILFFTETISYYPNLIHARIMVMGFLMSFVCGFLMTAIPRMSGTKAASSFEVSIILILILLQSFLAVANLLFVAGLVGTLQFLFLAVFIASRFFQKTQNPPSAFIFIPFGLVAGFLGTLALTFQDSLSPSFFDFGKDLLYQGFILNLIVGLGGRLIPVLSRVPGALDPTQQATRSPWSHLWTLFLLNFSFVVESFISKPMGLMVRFFILVCILIFEFKIFRKPTEKTWLGICIRSATVFMAVPYLFAFIWPGYEVHLLHISFISGFSLMTLMVAVRVILSHGGHSLSFEKNSNILPIIAILLLLATFIRSLIPIVAPDFFLPSVLTAATLWSLAIIFWISTFLSKFFETKLPIRK